MLTLSVIMTTYRENPKFLRLCIDKILNQTFRNYEFIIVIEPNETNRDYLINISHIDNRVKVLENEVKLGVAGSRNRAIKESCGIYIAIIDGDDYCDLTRFEKQLKFLENNPEISVVGSNMYLVDENNDIIGERKYPGSYPDVKKMFLLENAVANPTAIVRKKVFTELGVFDDKLRKSEDFELWMRFLANGKKICNVQENLLYYRVLSNHNEKRCRDNWKNNYIARKKYSKFIWPLYQRIFSLFFYFLVSCLPVMFLDGLLNFKIVKIIKKVNKINDKQY